MPVIILLVFFFFVINLDFWGWVILKYSRVSKRSAPGDSWQLPSKTFLLLLPCAVIGTAVFLGYYMWYLYITEKSAYMSVCKFTATHKKSPELISFFSDVETRMTCSLSLASISPCASPHLCVLVLMPSSPSGLIGMVALAGLVMPVAASTMTTTLLLLGSSETLQSLFPSTGYPEFGRYSSLPLLQP